MGFQLRPLSVSDKIFVSDLYQDECIMRHIGAVLSDQQVAGLCGKMLREVESKTAVYQVIVSSNGAHRAGLLSMHWQPDNQVIESGMIVLPAFQNQGVCKWAQMTAMRKVKDMFPVKVCTVYISADNIAANTSYKNMGFVPIENKSKLKKHLNLNRWDFNMELLNQ